MVHVSATEAPRQALLARGDNFLALIRATPGLTSRIAAACKIRTQAVSQWKRVPLRRVPAVESATGIPRALIRPDYAWTPLAAREASHA